MSSWSQKFYRRWQIFWLQRGGVGSLQRIATRLGSVGVLPFRGRYLLADLTPKGYVAPDAEIIGLNLQLGANVYIGEGALFAKWEGTGNVKLGARVHINRECSLELFTGGQIEIGDDAKVQARCLFVAAVQPIRIGRRVQIAPYCTFFSYDHQAVAGRAIYEQPLCSKGPIVIEEDAWLGVGATVLCGVTIGKGAVVGAGAVVTRDVPAGAIAIGNAARVVKYRDGTGAPVGDRAKSAGFDQRTSTNT